MKRLLLGAVCALAFATTSEAAQTITVTAADFDDGYALVGFSPPNGGQYARVEFNFNDLTLLPETYMYAMYLQTYYFWDTGFGLNNNGRYLPTFCDVGSSCIRGAGFGRAEAEFVGAPNFGDIDSCHPTDDYFECYGLSDPILSVIEIYADISGPNPWIEITIGDPAALPEPGAWTLMLLGFGLVGAALRRPRLVRAR